MTNKELFKQAVNEGFMIRMERDAAVIEKDIICSEGHYQKLSEIFGFEVKNPKIRRKTIRRTVAAILIAAALLLAGCTAVVYKEKIGDFFTTAFETCIKGYFVSDDSENNSIIEEYYTLTYVPEGYELVENNSCFASVMYVMGNADGNKLVFGQTPIESTKFSFDIERGTESIVYYDDCTIYGRVYDGGYTYIWSNEKYCFSLDGTGELSEEELLKIIDGISLKSK